MAKIEAQDYFKNSALFDAEQIDGKSTNSATSSAVRYELTCKECGGVNTKTGNSKTLNTCSFCGYVWDRVNNKVLGPGAKGAEATAKPKATPVVETDSDDDLMPHKIVPLKRRNAFVAKEEEVKPVATPSRKKITVESIADLLTKSSQGTLPAKAEPVKTKALKNSSDVYEIEEVIDYYDERLEDRWHRNYLVRWKGYDKPSFVLDKDFVDKKFLASFEESLPEEERFETIFPGKARKNKGTKHAVRAKIDVLNDNGDVEHDEEVVESLPSAAPKDTAIETPQVATTTGDCVEIKTGTFQHVKLKVGQIIRIGDTFVEAVL